MRLTAIGGNKRNKKYKAETKTNIENVNVFGGSLEAHFANPQRALNVPINFLSYI